MLSSLEIKDILLIEDLSINFTKGLNVFSGETGAGKSILLDCLSFVLGFRGKSNYVRQGASYGEVVVTFELSKTHKIWHKLENAGFNLTDQELIIKRQNFKDGRKVSFINEKRCSNQIIREFSHYLVEVQGQNDDSGLRAEAGPRDLLDIFGNLLTEVQQVKSVWEALVNEKRVLSQMNSKEEEVKRDRDYLKYAIEEIEHLSPQIGEEESLEKKRRFVKASKRIKDELSESYNILENGLVEQNIDSALRLLTNLGSNSELEVEDTVDCLEQGSSVVAKVKKNIADMISNLNFDSHILEEIEDRLYNLKDLSRKFNVTVDGLSDLAEDFSNRLKESEDTILGSKNRITRIGLLEKQYDALAKALSKKRQKVAENLNHSMSKQLPSLKLDQAKFKTIIEPSDAGPKGIDKIGFHVSTNTGMPFAPIAKVASGGELSRFLLALKVSIKNSEENTTLIFDEIDSGVGGATADAVGQRLRRLAEGSQILVVTHSPQVAALGDHHIKVVKNNINAKNLINIFELNSIERVDEIGRMLSGDTITNEARLAAEVLLRG